MASLQTSESRALDGSTASHAASLVFLLGIRIWAYWYVGVGLKEFRGENEAAE